MISKNNISEIRKLHQKKFRDAERLFIVEGRKSVEMLLQSDFEVQDIYATESAAQENQYLLQKQMVTLVASAEMERISTLSTPPELLAVARQRHNQGQVPDDEPLLVLDRIADPGNLGTIVRTANWFGIRHIVCSPDTVEFYNPKCIQATMGAFCDVQVSRADLVSFLDRQCASRHVLGTFLDGESVDTFAFQPDDIVVIGSESDGISAPVARCVTHRLTIPRGVGSGYSSESLNAAVAAAIVMQQFATKS